MLTEPHIFPRDAPPGYSYLDEEPEFEPARDLQLEQPKTLTTLAELGYPEEFQADHATPLAVTSALRVLSDTGVEKLRGVIKRLWPYAIHSPDPRVAPVLRGAVYRSRFIRDLVLSPDITAFLSECAGAALVPSAFPFQLARINHASTARPSTADGWHHDENGFTLLLSAHDPTDLVGGRFQYFRGTRDEAKELLAEGEPLPEERLTVVELPGPGYAVAIQGSALVHRTEPLSAPGERFTLGTGYETRDVRSPDTNRMLFLRESAEERQDPEAEAERFCRFLDYARHKAWRARGHLDDFIQDTAWTDDRELIVRQLAEAVREVVEAVDVLRRGELSKREAQRVRAHIEGRRKRR